MYCEVFTDIPLDVRRDILSIYLHIGSYKHIAHMMIRSQDEYKEMIDKKAVSHDFWVDKILYLIKEKGNILKKNPIIYWYDIGIYALHNGMSYALPHVLKDYIEIDEHNISLYVSYYDSFGLRYIKDFDEKLVNNDWFVELIKLHPRFIEDLLESGIVKNGKVSRSLLNICITRRYYPCIGLIITQINPKDILYAAHKAIQTKDDILFDLVLSVDRQLLINRALLANNYHILCKIFRLSFNTNPINIMLRKDYTPQQKILILGELERMVSTSEFSFEDIKNAQRKILKSLKGTEHYYNSVDAINNATHL